MTTTDYSRLEGTLLDCFDVDRAQHSKFLIQFKWLTTMDREAIACDASSRCAYLLSLIDGPKVEGWIKRSYDWLNKIENDLSLIPLGKTT
jgi:hypothetical protein